MALQDEVTNKIIGALTGENGRLKRAQYRAAWGKDTANLEEYDYYLRGHDLFMRFEPELQKQVGDIWEEGLAKFPTPLSTSENGGTSLFTVTPLSSIEKSPILRGPGYRKINW